MEYERCETPGHAGYGYRMRKCADCQRAEDEAEMVALEAEVQRLKEQNRRLVGALKPLADISGDLEYHLLGPEGEHWHRYSTMPDGSEVIFSTEAHVELIRNVATLLAEIKKEEQG